MIRRYSNVLVIATSNITGAIDLAFIDRADLKLFFGPPGLSAVYKILSSCVTELMRAGIVVDGENIIDYRTLELAGFAENSGTRSSLLLLDIAR